jgi:hypothetical protein
MSPARESEIRAAAILYFALRGIPVWDTTLMPLEEIRAMFEYLRAPRTREPV